MLIIVWYYKGLLNGWGEGQCCLYLYWRLLENSSADYFVLGNCNFQLKQYILFINEMKQNKNFVTTKQEKTFAQYCELCLKFWMTFCQLLSVFHSWTKDTTFVLFSLHEQKLAKFSLYLMNFPSHLAIFSINLLDFYQIKWKIAKFNEI